MRLLAIDFGTSNTVAALLIDGQAPRTVNFDTSPMLPSAVYYSVDGRLTVGREAQRLARLDPTRFEPNPKRRVDDGEMLLGDRVLPVVDALAAVLRAVAIEVRRQLGGALPDEVRLTHPAQWGAIRQNVLVSAARAAGLGANLVLIPEPVAAAAQFTRLPGRALPVGGTVAVYDLGGGTFDIAIVGRTERPGPGSGSTDAGQFHVLAERACPTSAGWTSTRQFSITSAGWPPAPIRAVGNSCSDRLTLPPGVPAGRWLMMCGQPRKRCRGIRRRRSRFRSRSSTPT